MSLGHAQSIALLLIGSYRGQGHFRRRVGSLGGRVHAVKLVTQLSHSFAGHSHKSV